MSVTFVTNMLYARKVCKCILTEEYIENKEILIGKYGNTNQKKSILDQGNFSG